MESYRTYSITDRTAALVPDFAVEDLPLGRTTALVPEFAMKDLPLDRILLLLLMINNFDFLENGSNDFD